MGAQPGDPDVADERARDRPGRRDLGAELFLALAAGVDRDLEGDARADRVARFGVGHGVDVDRRGVALSLRVRDDEPDEHRRAFARDLVGGDGDFAARAAEDGAARGVGREHVPPVGQR